MVYEDFEIGDVLYDKGDDKIKMPGCCFTP